MKRMEFTIQARAGAARRGQLQFERGTVDTPAFMPVGTYGTVKAMTPEEVRQLGAQIILGNTFHLWLRPGTEIIRKHGDLHDFMHWAGPILTDSGGFQVWSLSALRKLSEDGVHFASPINGDKVFLSPEISVQIQHALGSDIVMQFDECTPYPATEEQARESMELSARWAIRCRDEHADNPNALFGIVQGGMYPNLRHECANLIFPAMPLVGYRWGRPVKSDCRYWTLSNPKCPWINPAISWGSVRPWIFWRRSNVASICLIASCRPEMRAMGIYSPVTAWCA